MQYFPYPWRKFEPGYVIARLNRHLHTILSRRQAFKATIGLGGTAASALLTTATRAAMLNLAAEAAASIALTHRGVFCKHRDTALNPNLWWFPLNPMESPSALEVNVNA